MSETIEGLRKAHDILVEYSRELTAHRLKWWQTGAKRYHKTEAVVELSERLFAEIEREMERIAAWPPTG